MTTPIDWHFNEQHPGDTSREPIQGEFFAEESIENAAAALVREGIQNSLDARDGAAPVRIRIYVSGRGATHSPAVIAPYFADLRPHLEAPRNGLRDVPGPRESCPFLVFEDFGTTGLLGDPGQWHHVDGSPNGFFAFFRAEGLSDKSQHDRGRWGVGKFVFPRSSRISTFFGLTIRKGDSGPNLLGRCILKSHLSGMTRFCPDGYFGSLSPLGLVLPVVDRQWIRTFAQTWHLARTDEPGLSIVVPHPDPEITFESLLTAVVRDYFFAILQGQLVVDVETDGQHSTVTADTLDSLVAAIGKQEERERIAGRVSLARWMMNAGAGDVVELDPPEGRNAPDWSPSMVPQPVLDRIRKVLGTPGDRILCDVPVIVRPKKGAPSSATFRIGVERRSDDIRERPLFVREGLIISDVRSRRPRGLRAIVVVEEGPLATFLGDSENPSHTKWTKDSSNFKGKYLHGPGLLDFVTESVARLVGIVQQSDDQIDRDILADFFSIPLPDTGEAPGRPTQHPGTKPPRTPPIPPPRLQPVRVSETPGGFRVSRGDRSATVPALIKVQVAYDIRSGSPLANWEPEDFSLVAAPLVYDPAPRGVRIVQAEGNTLEVEVTESDFDFGISGFDRNRDLYVSIRTREE